MEIAKRVWQWISTHTRYALLILVIILITVLILWWGRKNRRIKELENQLAVLTAKLQLEKLTWSYNTTMSELKGLREKDEKVGKEITQIEDSLANKLSPGMSAEDIAAKFKEIGIR